MTVNSYIVASTLGRAIRAGTVDQHSLLIHDFEDDAKLASIGAVVDEGHTADFDESGETHIKILDAKYICPKGTVGKISQSSSPFQQRVNIENYLLGCAALGMQTVDLFTTGDLFDDQNVVAVIDNIFSLGALSRTVESFPGPYIGTTFATKNEREFTQEQIVAGRQFVPMTSEGSIEIEKEKGTDNIVRYGKVGQEMGKASSEVSQVNAGSIAVEKDVGTDFIVRYGKVGQEMGKASSEVSQVNAGSIAVEKDVGTDFIVRYGKVGQEMGKASSEISQQNAGAIHVPKEDHLDSISRAANGIQTQ